MIGQRRDNPMGFLPCAGDFGRDANGDWFGCTPNAHGVNLSLHSVTEHEDFTITVSPSIKVSRGDVELWHGYLERGVWRAV